jgi:hypothetical protein
VPSHRRVYQPEIPDFSHSLVRRDDIELLARSSKIFVNAMFTTFVRVRFTNVFVCTAPISANPCVWRACIAD